MAEIKMYVADTIDLVQKWVNENNLEYDSIKLQCHSCDNSTSGAVFTVYGREGNSTNSENANCAIFDVSKMLPEIIVSLNNGEKIKAIKCSECDCYFEEKEIQIQGDFDTCDDCLCPE